MFSESVRVNIMSRAIEDICKKFDITLTDAHKTAINVIVSAVIFKDNSIIIFSEAIHQIDRLIKKHNDKIDFVSILLGIDCISDIDKYGTITIPLAVLLSKLTIKKEIISNSTNTFKKKVMTNVVQTLCISDILIHLGVPKPIAITAVNVIIQLLNSKLDDEYRIMYNSNAAFKNYKMSDTKRILKSIEFERILISTIILIIVSYSGLKLGSSLIIINVADRVLQLVKVNYKEKRIKSFLN